MLQKAEEHKCYICAKFNICVEFLGIIQKLF